MAKYRPKFARELRDGLRKNGWSIAECCLHWKVSVGTYYNWIEAHPKFAEAATVGELDAAAWWHRLNRDVASGVEKGNAGLIQFALKNIEGINWADKVEVNNTYDEQVHTLNINVLPSYDERMLIEEGEVVEHDSIEHKPD